MLNKKFSGTGCNQPLIGYLIIFYRRFVLIDPFRVVIGPINLISPPVINSNLITMSFAFKDAAYIFAHSTADLTISEESRKLSWSICAVY